MADGQSNYEGRWGSDLIADALREQNIPYVCLVPGASFRGLHDSIVNHLGNQLPKMLVCLHEEHSVAIAHGWAQVTNEPLAVLLHTNVGLMHATMPIFNMWCDRMPAVIIGAGGPRDAEKRRPWIDWIHSATDQGSLIRDYTKWDDQPGSAVAAVESVRRAGIVSRTSPMGPVYVNLDIAYQEELVADPVSFYDAAQYRPSSPPRPSEADIEVAFEMLSKAENPIALIGRVSRDEAAWAERIKLAEYFGIGVYSVYNSGAGFPKTHRLHRDVLRLTIDDKLKDQLRAADVVLSLNWTDLGGTAWQIWPRGEELPKIIHCSDEFHLHRGWSLDYQPLQPAALRIGTSPDSFVAAMLEKCERQGPATAKSRPAPARSGDPARGAHGDLIGLVDLAAAFNEVTEGDKVTLVSKAIGWPNSYVRVDHPLDFLGAKGGEGLGAGPGMAVGAALAIRDRHPGRLVTAVLGDGDYLMGGTALWTAAAERVPLLVIVVNNRSYFNDVVHQERVARRRGRPVENKWIGQRIDDPAPDHAAFARSLGLEGGGPVGRLADLKPAMEEAVRRVKQGATYVLDVQVAAGYAAPIA